MDNEIDCITSSYGRWVSLLAASFLICSAACTNTCLLGTSTVSGALTLKISSTALMEWYTSATLLAAVMVVPLSCCCCAAVPGWRTPFSTWVPENDTKTVSAATWQIMLGKLLCRRCTRGKQLRTGESIWRVVGCFGIRSRQQSCVSISPMNSAWAKFHNPAALTLSVYVAAKV